MSEWEKPETWEHATKAMESFVAATAVVSTGLAKLKKTLARKNRQKRDIVKEVDELKSSLENLMNVLSESFKKHNTYLQSQLTFVSCVQTIFDRLIAHEKSTKTLAEVIVNTANSTTTAIVRLQERISKVETPPMIRTRTRAKRNSPP